MVRKGYNPALVEEVLGAGAIVVGDATALPWADARFTVATSNCRGCYKKKAAKALGEMCRVPRPGGRAVVGDDRRETMEAVGLAR